MNNLEDNAADILGKALRGLGLAAADAAEKSGLTEDSVSALLSGEFDETDARALAAALHLDAAALARVARGAYRPDVPHPANLVPIATTYGDMTVNAYVVWDRDQRVGAIFDTGAAAAPILELVERENLDIVAIFLTHSHADHIAALDDLVRELDVEAWSSETEPVAGTRNFRPGDYFNVGRHFIRTRLTPGHSPGGATFIIEGHNVQAAVVGDALFAGSIGGVRGDYPATLATIRREILGLPDDTLLCPGHGPLTTVALEKANNPFFA